MKDEENVDEIDPKDLKNPDEYIDRETESTDNKTKRCMVNMENRINEMESQGNLCSTRVFQFMSQNSFFTEDFMYVMKFFAKLRWDDQGTFDRYNSNI